MARLDFLLRQPPLLLHQIDEAEIARTKDDDVPARDVVLCGLRLPSRRLGGGVTDHRILLVAALERADVAVSEVPLDELVEPVAVPLAEGRSLRLAVIGQDDELVRACGVAAGALDAPELLVELPQRFERVLAFEAGVVRDLVVAREGRVDRRPPLHHVAEDAVDNQVADDDAHRRPQERIGAAPMAARADVTPTLLRSGDPLDDQLPGEEDERPRDVEAVREEGAVARVGRALGLHAADREDHVVGAAREEVAAARASVREETRSARVPPLELGAVLRRRAGDERFSLLLDPAEGDDAVVRAEQDAGLRGAGLGGEVRLPLGEPVRPVLEPARHRRRVPVAHCPL